MNCRGIRLLLIILLFAGSAYAADVSKEKIIWAPSVIEPFGLFLSNPDGSNERPLLPGSESNYNASFSPDGHWVVFTSERFGSADIFRVHPDGSNLERLTDSPAFDDQGSLSPDGKTLAFVSTRAAGTADIWLLDIARHQARNLTQSRTGNFRPSWSPNGNWIAFSSDRNPRSIRHMRGNEPAWELMQRTAIYIVHPDGSGLKRLTALDGCAESPRWSHDSMSVVFAQSPDMEELRHYRERRLQIVSINIVTGAREIQSDGKSYVWSPGYVSNTEIGYGRYGVSDRESSIVYTSGGKGPAHAENPSWSPDGSMLVYDRKLPYTDKWMEARQSRDRRYELITGVPFRPFPPSFVIMPGGQRLIYHSPSGEQLVLSKWDGTDARVVFDGTPENSQVWGGSVARDGRAFVFEIWKRSPPEAPSQLAVMDGDVTHLRVVPRSTDHDGCDFLSLSADGTRLVCRVEHIKLGLRTEQGLRIISLADGKTDTLTSGWDNTPAWSPLGDRIAFTGFETGDFEIYTIRPDGTDLRQLTHTHGNDSHPVWSPDGKWIAFLSSRMGWKDENLLPKGGFGGQSYGEIFVMRADGTDVRQLTDNQWEEGVSAWLPAASGSAYPP